jgi:hypothetical protein
MTKLWNGQFFERVSLRQMGLVVQLGHLDGSQCENPIHGPSRFFVLHTNGIHCISLMYCSCRQSISTSTGLFHQKWEQIMRARWFPGTHSRPKTACTFQMLEQFHMLTLCGKITAFDYYKGLEKITSNIGQKIPVSIPNLRNSRSDSFSNRIVTQPCYVLFVNGGIFGCFDVVVAEMMVSAVLKKLFPGNLPSNVLHVHILARTYLMDGKKRHLTIGMSAVFAKAGLLTRFIRFIYNMFISFDACFRLKRKRISTWKKDPSLQDGWAYFVENEPYLDWVHKMARQKEVYPVYIWTIRC